MEAQYGPKMILQDGSLTQLGGMMDGLNLFFTAYFIVELFMNVYANWFRAFFSSGWNHLDIFIVLMSLLDLSPSHAIDIPDWFVKLVRAFRVIRLFGRIKELKKMAAAVTASIFPMLNAFVILLICLSICAFLQPDTHSRPRHDPPNPPAVCQIHQTAAQCC
jgi:hypothetical protein